jgi:hypothetical protein
MIRAPACLALVVWLTAALGEAGQAPTHVALSEPAGAHASAGEMPHAFDGPSPPVHPDVIARDASGRATVRATRLTTPIRLDGRLDEAVYATVQAMSDFIQMEPKEGEPASEKTDVWVFFDADYVYVSLRCWESQPERIIANEMRRDNAGIWRDDAIQFLFDTFYDRRNAVVFSVNAAGGLADGQVSDERQWNMDWNPVWKVAASRFDRGWTAEAAVPFKSLRYRGGARAQVWSFNAQRINRWKNEVSFLTRIPTTATGTSGIARVSRAATLVGLEVPPAARNIEIKPYLSSALVSDENASPGISNDVRGDAGVDVRYGITRSVKAEFTYNTDFAQVEADEQQVNLTRFSLFFPEKREFFLENRGTFAFGGAGTGGAGDTPILFYSRRIGLQRGREIPIRAGGRVTGRLGRYEFGALNIQTDDEPTSMTAATTFSVLRVKRDVLRRSSVGAIFTRRSAGLSAPGGNEAYGVDGTFAFFEYLALNTYWARTRTNGLSAEDTSYRMQLDYAGDRYGLQLERLAVGDHFNPEVGFVRRDDMRRSFGQVRFSPRSRAIKAVRKFSWIASVAYVEDSAGKLETRERDAEFAVEFQNSDRFSVAYGDNYEALLAPFEIATGVIVPPGGYDFGTGRVALTLGQQRSLSSTVAVEHGSFYDGEKSTLSITRSRMEITPHFSLEPSFTVNWVDLPQGAFTTYLTGSRVTHTMTPRMFVSALFQYNSSINAVSTNIRLRWEYQPGSELFVTYNEERDTLARRFPHLENRTVIVKLTRLFRF